MTDKERFSERAYLEVRGGKSLKGELRISGAKNSILPLLFASLLAEGKHNFTNVPDLKDVDLALNILSSLGLVYERSEGNLSVQNFGLSEAEPCRESARSFRASVLCLGPLLAVSKKVILPLPGGCNIGARPIDIHLKGLAQLGAKVFIDKDMIHGIPPKEGLKASEITLDFPSVGATENLIMTAVLARGSSHLKNTANEPEIIQLIDYLNHLGAQIEFVGERELKITGVSSLKSSSRPFELIPDRIEAGTWLIAGACTKGEILIKACQPDHLTALLEKLKSIGCQIHSEKSEILLKTGESSFSSTDIKTGVYPLFPTDLQSQFMALMTQLEGPSSLEESIFENRFRYIEQLNHLGAGIQMISPRHATVKGPVRLKAGKMEATDLRAGAGLVLAGLIAEGTSRIYGLHHIERGYEKFFSKLSSLQADVSLCN